MKWGNSVQMSRIILTAIMPERCQLLNHAIEMMKREGNENSY